MNYQEELQRMDLFDFAPGREGYYGDYGGAVLPPVPHLTNEGMRAGLPGFQNDPALRQGYRAATAG